MSRRAPTVESPQVIAAKKAIFEMVRSLQRSLTTTVVLPLDFFTTISTTLPENPPAGHPKGLGIYKQELSLPGYANYATESVQLAQRFRGVIRSKGTKEKIAPSENIELIKFFLEQCKEIGTACIVASNSQVSPCINVFLEEYGISQGPDGLIKSVYGCENGRTDIDIMADIAQKELGAYPQGVVPTILNFDINPVPQRRVNYAQEITNRTGIRTRFVESEHLTRAIQAMGRNAAGVQSGFSAERVEALREGVYEYKTTRFNPMQRAARARLSQRLVDDLSVLPNAPQPQTQHLSTYLFTTTAQGRPEQLVNEFQRMDRDAHYQIFETICRNKQIETPYYRGRKDEVRALPVGRKERAENSILAQEKIAELLIVFNNYEQSFPEEYSVTRKARGFTPINGEIVEILVDNGFLETLADLQDPSFVQQISQLGVRSNTHYGNFIQDVVLSLSDEQVRKFAEIQAKKYAEFQFYEQVEQIECERLNMWVAGIAVREARPQEQREQRQQLEDRDRLRAEEAARVAEARLHQQQERERVAREKAARRLAVEEAKVRATAERRLVDEFVVVPRSRQAPQPAAQAHVELLWKRDNEAERLRALENLRQLALDQNNKPAFLAAIDQYLSRCNPPQDDQRNIELFEEVLNISAPNDATGVSAALLYMAQGEYQGGVARTRDTRMMTYLGIYCESADRTRNPRLGANIRIEEKSLIEISLKRIRAQVAQGDQMDIAAVRDQLRFLQQFLFNTHRAASGLDDGNIYNRINSWAEAGTALRDPQMGEYLTDDGNGTHVNLIYGELFHERNQLARQVRAPAMPAAAIVDATIAARDGVDATIAARDGGLLPNAGQPQQQLPRRPLTEPAMVPAGQGTAVSISQQNINNRHTGARTQPARPVAQVALTVVTRQDAKTIIESFKILSARIIEYAINKQESRKKSFYEEIKQNLIAIRGTALRYRAIPEMANLIVWANGNLEKATFRDLESKERGAFQTHSLAVMRDLIPLRPGSLRERGILLYNQQDLSHQKRQLLVVLRRQKQENTVATEQTDIEALEAIDVQQVPEIVIADEAEQDQAEAAADNGAGAAQQELASPPLRRAQVAAAARADAAPAATSTQATPKKAANTSYFDPYANLQYDPSELGSPKGRAAVASAPVAAAAARPAAQASAVRQVVLESQSIKEALTYFSTRSANEIAKEIYDIASLHPDQAILGKIIPYINQAELDVRQRLDRINEVLAIESTETKKINVLHAVMKSGISEQNKAVVIDLLRVAKRQNNALVRYGENDAVQEAIKVLMIRNNSLDALNRRNAKSAPEVIANAKNCVKRSLFFIQAAIESGVYGDKYNSLAEPVRTWLAQIDGLVGVKIADAVIAPFTQAQRDVFAELMSPQRREEAQARITARQEILGAPSAAVIAGLNQGRVRQPAPASPAPSRRRDDNAEAAASSSAMADADTARMEAAIERAGAAASAATSQPYSPRLKRKAIVAVSQDEVLRAVSEQLHIISEAVREYEPPVRSLLGESGGNKDKKLPIISEALDEIDRLLKQNISPDTYDAKKQGALEKVQQWVDSFITDRGEVTTKKHNRIVRALNIAAAQEPRVLATATKEKNQGVTTNQSESTDTNRLIGDINAALEPEREQDQVAGPSRFKQLGQQFVDPSNEIDVAHLPPLDLGHEDDDDVPPPPSTPAPTTPPRDFGPRPVFTTPQRPSAAQQAATAATNAAAAAAASTVAPAATAKKEFTKEDADQLQEIYAGLTERGFASGKATVTTKKTSLLEKVLAVRSAKNDGDYKAAIELLKGSLQTIVRLTQGKESANLDKIATWASGVLRETEAFKPETKMKEGQRSLTAAGGKTLAHSGEDISTMGLLITTEARKFAKAQPAAVPSDSKKHEVSTADLALRQQELQEQLQKARAEAASAAQLGAPKSAASAAASAPASPGTLRLNQGGRAQAAAALANTAQTKAVRLDKEQITGGLAYIGHAIPDLISNQLAMNPINGILQNIRECTGNPPADKQAKIKLVLGLRANDNVDLGILEVLAISGIEAKDENLLIDLLLEASQEQNPLTQYGKDDFVQKTIANLILRNDAYKAKETPELDAGIKKSLTLIQAAINSGVYGDRYDALLQPIAAHLKSQGAIDLAPFTLEQNTAALFTADANRAAMVARAAEAGNVAGASASAAAGASLPDHAQAGKRRLPQKPGTEQSRVSVKVTDTDDEQDVPPPPSTPAPTGPIRSFGSPQRVPGATKTNAGAATAFTPTGQTIKMATAASVLETVTSHAAQIEQKASEDAIIRTLETINAQANQLAVTKKGLGEQVAAWSRKNIDAKNFAQAVKSGLKDGQTDLAQITLTLQKAVLVEAMAAHSRPVATVDRSALVAAAAAANAAQELRPQEYETILEISNGLQGKVETAQAAIQAAILSKDKRTQTPDVQKAREADEAIDALKAQLSALRPLLERIKKNHSDDRETTIVLDWVINNLEKRVFSSDLGQSLGDKLKDLKASGQFLKESEMLRTNDHSLHDMVPMIRGVVARYNQPVMKAAAVGAQERMQDSPPPPPPPADGDVASAANENNAQESVITVLPEGVAPREDAHKAAPTQGSSLGARPTNAPPPVPTAAAAVSAASQQAAPQPPSAAAAAATVSLGLKGSGAKAEVLSPQQQEKQRKAEAAALAASELASAKNESTKDWKELTGIVREMPATAEKRQLVLGIINDRIRLNGNDFGLGASAATDFPDLTKVLELNVDGKDIISLLLEGYVAGEKYPEIFKIIPVDRLLAVEENYEQKASNNLLNICVKEIKKISLEIFQGNNVDVNKEKIKGYFAFLKEALQRIEESRLEPAKKEAISGLKEWAAQFEKNEGFAPGIAQPYSYTFRKTTTSGVKETYIDPNIALAQTNRFLLAVLGKEEEVSTVLARFKQDFGHGHLDQAALVVENFGRAVKNSDQRREFIAGVLSFEQEIDHVPNQNLLDYLASSRNIKTPQATNLIKLLGEYLDDSFVSNDGLARISPPTFLQRSLMVISQMLAEEKSAKSKALIAQGKTESLKDKIEFTKQILDIYVAELESREQDAPVDLLKLYQDATNYLGGMLQEINQPKEKKKAEEATGKGKAKVDKKELTRIAEEESKRREEALASKQTAINDLLQRVGQFTRKYSSLAPAKTPQEQTQEELARLAKLRREEAERIQQQLREREAAVQALAAQHGAPLDVTARANDTGAVARQTKIHADLPDAQGIKTQALEALVAINQAIKDYKKPGTFGRGGNKEETIKIINKQLTTLKNLCAIFQAEIDLFNVRTFVESFLETSSKAERQAKGKKGSLNPEPQINDKKIEAALNSAKDKMLAAEKEKNLASATSTLRFETQSEFGLSGGNTDSITLWNQVRQASVESVAADQARTTFTSFAGPAGASALRPFAEAGQKEAGSNSSLSSDDSANQEDKGSGGVLGGALRRSMKSMRSLRRSAKSSPEVTAEQAAAQAAAAAAQAAEQEERDRAAQEEIARTVARAEQQVQAAEMQQLQITVLGQQTTDSIWTPQRPGLARQKTPDGTPMSMLDVVVSPPTAFKTPRAPIGQPSLKQALADRFDDVAPQASDAAASAVAAAQLRSGSTVVNIPPRAESPLAEPFDDLNISSIAPPEEFARADEEAAERKFLTTDQQGEDIYGNREAVAPDAAAALKAQALIPTQAQGLAAVSPTKVGTHRRLPSTAGLAPAGRPAVNRTTKGKGTVVEEVSQAAPAQDPLADLFEAEDGLDANNELLAAAATHGQEVVEASAVVAASAKPARPSKTTKEALPYLDMHKQRIIDALNFIVESPDMVISNESALDPSADILSIIKPYIEEAGIDQDTREAREAEVMALRSENGMTVLDAFIIGGIIEDPGMDKARLINDLMYAAFASDDERIKGMAMYGQEHPDAVRLAINYLQIRFNAYVDDLQNQDPNPQLREGLRNTLLFIEAAIKANVGVVDGVDHYAELLPLVERELNKQDRGYLFSGNDFGQFMQVFARTMPQELQAQDQEEEPIPPAPRNVVEPRADLPLSAQKKQAADEFIQACLDAGIDIVKIDNDGTALDVHTFHSTKFRDESPNQAFLGLFNGSPRSAGSTFKGTKQQAQDLFADAPMLHYIFSNLKANGVETGIISRGHRSVVGSIWRAAGMEDCLSYQLDRGGLISRDQTSGQEGKCPIIAADMQRVSQQKGRPAKMLMMDDETNQFKPLRDEAKYREFFKNLTIVGGLSTDQQDEAGNISKSIHQSQEFAPWESDHGAEGPGNNTRQAPLGRKKGAVGLTMQAWVNTAGILKEQVMEQQEETSHSAAHAGAPSAAPAVSGGQRAMSDEQYQERQGVTDKK